MNDSINDKHFYWLIGLITLAAGILRFWQLGEANQLVFDEVYFAKFGHNYLTGSNFFDVHPPLSKYLIAAGIWIHNHLPWINDPAISAGGIETLSPWSWRWLNAFTGTLLTLIIAKLAHGLLKNKLFTILACIFIATDGTFIVESRYALNNIYLVLFGTLAVLFIVEALNSPKALRRNLALCGVFLGLTYSVKWNGLGYSLAVWAIVFAPLIIFLANKYIKHPVLSLGQHERVHFYNNAVPFWECIFYLFILPFIVHVIVWQPHLAVITDYSFWEMQKQILGYHSTSVEATDHPYCSRWYSWPLLIRPISYIFESHKESPNPADHFLIDVHLFGNPILFWISAVAMAAVTILWIVGFLTWYRYRKTPKNFLALTVITFGFAANWLPWMIVTRCVFQYHYMPASVFTFLATAYLVTLALDQKRKWLRVCGWDVLVAIAIGFIYWLPIQLGIKLSPEGFYSRMWLHSWI